MRADRGSSGRGIDRPGYFLVVAILACVYFFFSDKMLTSLKFREAIAPRLGPLGRILPVDRNWGLAVLAALLIYWGALWIRARRRNSRKDADTHE